MNTYPAYKDSGVEWIGEIPSEWSVERLGHFFTERKKKVDDISYPPLSVTMNGILDQLDDVAKSDDTTNRKLVLKNDFVINSRSDRKGSSGISFRDGSVSLINTVLEPKNIYPNYVEYLLKSYHFIEEYFRFGKGIHFDLWSTNFSVMKNIKIPVLSIEKQQQISDYLDYKTSKIDTLIEKTQQKIELLKEQRTSLINTTVTKGLNPNVEMKDSGVEWIGEIPSGWELKPLKYFSEITLGKMLTPKDPGGYVLKPYLRSKNVQSEIPDITDVREMWFSEKDLKKYKLNREDLLVNEGGDAGRTTIWNNELSEVYIQNSVNRVKIVKGVSRYYLYQFTLNHVTGYFDSIVSRVSIPHLTKDKLERVKFICPSRQEQQQIVDYLDKETLKIDKLIDIESRRIDLLKEYRQSLISDVVTGKVDVRNGVLV